jgi:hypothetical protein
MGEREHFPNQPCTTKQCTISFQMSMQTIIYQRTISMCLFQILQQTLKFDFSVFSKKQKQCFLKENIIIHFPKRILTTSMRKHKIKS